MKITNARVIVCSPGRNFVTLKIETDEGHHGIGDATLNGRELAVVSYLTDHVIPCLIGRDPQQIEDIWQYLYKGAYWRRGPVTMSAIAAVDTALWDIKGRALGVPVHVLLGGPVRDKIRSYCWIGGDRPANLIEGARAMQARGYDAVKFNICEELQIVDTYAAVDRIITRLFDLRDAVGASMDLAFDFHGRVHAPMARVLLKELEPLRPIFVEDAVVSAMVETRADLARATSIPRCIGERLHSRYDFKQVFERRAAQVINPDTAHVGGISEMVRIGHWAEAYDVALAPHCPLGPIALAACLQVDAVCHNAFIQEQSLGIHYNQGGDLTDYTLPGHGFTLHNGHLSIPTGPGLGIEVDDALEISEQTEI